MRWWWTTAVLVLCRCTAALQVVLDQKPGNQEQCYGMYSKSSWSGARDPIILVNLFKQEQQTQNVSVLICEFNDLDLVGRLNPETAQTQYICDSDAIRLQLCNATNVGEYLLAPNASAKAHSAIMTKTYNLSDPQPFEYPIKNTGYYCVYTMGQDGAPDYQATVNFRNAYGELAGSQIAKLPFYGGLTLAYAVMGIFWGFLYVQNRYDILQVQNYITAIIIFLIFEMLLTWGYYDYQNVHGSNLGSKAFMIIVAILNAFRNSFSFFLLLIVCMGYGVVKPSLGKTMLYVRILAGTHFIFGVVYTISSMNIHPEDAGLIVLLVILPLSCTLTAFYIWTLNSLGMTLKDLVQRQQHVKASMYRKLWWGILTTIVIIFAFFFINSFGFVSVGNRDFAPLHWQTRWFILDGWLNLVYYADVAFVAYLWRPTPNNRRFAMSDELAQDDDGFEIRSISDSLDDSDTETGRAKITTPASAPSSTSTTDGAAALHIQTGLPAHRTFSPLPAPKPRRPASLPRASFDGETIFAVGDEEKWSEDEADDVEKRNLVQKSSS